MKVKVLVIFISLILVLNGSLLVFGSGKKNDDIEEVDDEIKTEGLAKTPWPSFERDKENTHLSPYDTSYVDGTERWNFTTDWYFRSPPAIGADGTIYVGCYDENLYALDPDGTEKWRFETDFHIGSSPVIGSDGTVYIGSFDSNLYAIGEEEEKHSLTLQEPVGEGTIEVDGKEVTEWPHKETYDKNIEVRLKAVLDEGWQFKEWDGIYKSGT